MNNDLNKINNAKAYKRLNLGDWDQITQLEKDLQKRHNTEDFLIEFYQYKDNPGLVAVYKIDGKEVAKIALMADVQKQK